jgi:hypothetical protein
MTDQGGRRKAEDGRRKTEGGLALAALLLTAVVGCNKPLPQPGPVTQDSPADSAVLRSSVVAFSWLDAEQATAYELQVATDSKFKHLAVDDTLEAESVDAAVGPDGGYYWRVRPHSADSVWGDWSAIRWFNVERFRVVTSVKTQGYPHDICVSNGRAYIADGQAGLAVFDVTDPVAPVLLGTRMDSMNVAWGVASTDRYAYVSYGYKELYIVDVSQPESLRVAGEMEYVEPGFGYDIAVKDSFVLVAAGAQFIVVKIADPAHPDVKYQFDYPRDCRGIAVNGSRWYLACEQLGVAVWQWLVDSLPPVQVGSFDTPANALSVVVSGNYLYVADTRNGLVVADVSDPLNPRPVATLALSGYARHVSVADSLVYVSCEAGGLAVVNVARPEQPVLAATVNLPYTMCAQAEGGYVFAGDRDSGLVVIKLEE